MTFGEAINAGFRNYVNFTDRAMRSEYWFWVLFSILADVAAGLIDLVIARGYSPYSPLSTLVSLGLLLPSLAVAIRRLHDIDKSGWWILLGFIPLIGAIILIVWACQRGTKGPNRFGPDPLPGVV